MGDPTPVAGIAATGWVMLCAALVIERNMVGAVVAAVVGVLAGAAYVSGRKRRRTA